MAGLNYKDELVAEIYRKERIHEAEVERLVRQASKQKVIRIQLLNMLRNWLAKQLILLGTHLQEKPMSQYRS